MAAKMVNGRRTEKSEAPENDLCVVLHVEEDKCYIDYCRVPEQEKQKLLVK